VRVERASVGQALLGRILTLEAVRSHEDVEAGIEDVEDEAPLRCEVPRNGRQELQLIVDRGEMLDDAERRDDQGETARRG